jgi:VWFA-related protein
MRLALISILVIAVVPFATAHAKQPAFRSGIELVTVPITVTNAARDQLITAGLEAGDFRIFEGDEPQTIASLTQERRPISVCFVVDASGSMFVDKRHERGLRALEQAVRGLDDSDEVAIVRFASVATAWLPWTRRPERARLTWPLASDAGLVANSSIMDGVRRALTEIDRASNPHRVVVVISDGYENTSVTPLSRLVRTRQQSEAMIYAFGIAGPVERAPSGGSLRNILPAVVGESGGVYWSISTNTEADFAAMSLLAELKYQYVLAYSPAKAFDGHYRRIRVETTVRGLAVRHRAGYLAIPSKPQ